MVSWSKDLSVRISDDKMSAIGERRFGRRRALWRIVLWQSEIEKGLDRPGGA
jgi:hypothetical protein